MSWKWIITVLGIPVGANLSILLPRVDGIYIGDEKIKVNAEQIKDKEFSGEKKLTTIVGVEVENKVGKPKVEIWLPCISGDFVGSWMKNWGLDPKRKVIKQASGELNDIMKDAANIMFGCGNWFKTVVNKRKLEVLKKKMESISVQEKQRSSNSKEIKMGFDINVEINSLLEESASYIIEGVSLKFKEKKLGKTENYAKIQESMKNKLLESIKSVLREGRWSKNSLNKKNLESEFQNSARYATETNAENVELRKELEKCGQKCLLNGGGGVGISWNPDIRKKGGAGWFEEKLNSQLTSNFDMALGDALKSMWFNWVDLRVIIERELMRRLIDKSTKELNSKATKLCHMGKWGFVCPEGGLIWEKLN